MASVPSDKLKAAETALTQLERQFGKGSIMRLGAKEFAAISSISTGSIGVDAALGVGGVPRGRIIEIFGPESSGKTTLSLHVIAEAQRVGGLAAFIDAEHALDAEYAKKLGVDIDNLLVSQPDSGEQALEIAEMLVRSNAIDVIVIDSVAALVPRAELDVGYGEGISKTGELIDIGLEHKIVEKSGSWFSYGDMRLGQGRENAKLFIKENADLAAEIEGKVRKALGMGGTTPELTVIEGGEPVKNERAVR